MLIFGAGGHAKVIADCIENLEGIFDDNPSANCFDKVKFLGSYNSNVCINSHIVVGIGNNKIRKSIAEKLNHKFGVVIHPSAEVTKFTEIGEGTVVFPKAVINRDSKIGIHCIVNSGAIVEHDCILADYVHIASGTTLCGGVTVGESTIIGAGSVVIPFINIGKNCIIGAGSVVTNHIPDNVVVVGNPAKILKTND